MGWNHEIAGRRRRDAVDQNPAPIRLSADRFVYSQIVRGGNRQTRAGKVAPPVASSHPPNPPGLREPADHCAGFGADDGHSRGGGEETADFSGGDSSRADDDDGFVCEIEK